MDDTGDLCACIACSALCGLCCAVAAEEDRREREKTPSTGPGMAGKDDITYLDPVQVHKEAMGKIGSEKTVSNPVYDDTYISKPAQNYPKTA